MTDEAERGFLGRWSARKRAAAPVQEVDPIAARVEPPVEAPPSVSEEEAEALSDAEICERLKLPDPASLEHGADFKAFLRAGVPNRLRRLALRRLWAVSPGGAAFDGLIDYAEDFTDAAVGVETLSTTYEVGKGLKAHVDALAAKAQPEAEARAEPAPDDEASGSPEETVAQADPSPAETPSVVDKAEPVIREIPPEPVLQSEGAATIVHRKKPRKMAFRFKTD